ncbi:MAG TPA: gluconate:H+ symporter [Flavisolibacter sp.]|jgi:gluconate transporter|nr:gluconate:H+ symporter [Flavisolibacter sp.]
MPLLYVFLAISLLIFLIVKKVNPMLALLGVSILAGLLLGMPVPQVITSISNGIGSTLGGTIMVLALGAMIGKLAEESGAAQKLVLILVRLFGQKNIQWAVLLTGLLAGIPLFYNAGFVVLIPLVFAIAATTRLPLLYVGIPMAASLSVTHGFLPPHPGPVALAGIFHANIGTTLLYGLAIGIPTAVLAGIVFPRLVVKTTDHTTSPLQFEARKEAALPSGRNSLLIVLVPIVFIAAGTIGTALTREGAAHSFFYFLQDPTIALLLSLITTLILVKWPLTKSMEACTEGVKGIAMIILIIAAGGAFKQILIDSKVAELIKETIAPWQLSPLLFGWLVAAFFRIALGSATVAALTTSGMVAPLISTGVSAELMVLSVGAGSLMCSHVNDTGFWMFKEYFGLNLRQTFRTWTLMESLISLFGLAGVLLIQTLISH